MFQVINLYIYMMNLLPDYPIINSVESVLISQTQPTKSFSDFKNLVQSHHTTDNQAFFFNSPSPDVLAKLKKISPKDPLSLGTDSNANLKAIVLVALQNAFSSKEQAKQSFIIDKISNQEFESIKIQNIKNHNHKCLQSESTLKLVSSFLNTINTKRHQNIETFSLKKQLQDLPIILDYLIIFCRALLYKFRIQNAQDYGKFVKDTQAFNILSNYFGINFIQNESFYLFEQEKLFIYKDFDEYVIGWYSSVDNQSSHNKVSPLRKKSETNQTKKYINSEIMECSRQQGSNLLSSRNVDELTPCRVEEQGNLTTKRKSGKDPQTQRVNSLKLNSNHSAVKQFESKSSDFQANIYSEQKGKLFSNSYRNSKKKEQLIDPNKQKTQRQNIIQKVLNIDKILVKAHPFNGIQNHPRLQTYKRIRCDSNYFQTILSISKKERSESLGDRSLKLKYKGLTDKQKRATKKSSDCLHDNFLQWQNEDRPRRVQTICYKTCSTCHRRFFRNQLQSNVFEIKICAESKTKENGNIQNQPSTQLFFRNAPEFLNKKNQKKQSNEGNVQTSIVKDNLIHLKSPLKERQKINSERGLQFNWLNKRNKVDNASYFENRQSPRPLVDPSTSPRQSNIKNKKPMEPQSGQQTSKKVLSLKKLFFHHKQGQKLSQKNVIVPIKVSQERKFSSDTQQLGPKAKSFFTLKSATELQKIEQIGKLSQIREKSANQRQTKKLGKILQITNTLTTKGNSLTINNNQKSRSDETKKRDEALNSVVRNKSPEKWLPRFIKKDSLCSDLNGIINI